jgi:iron complex outermembrane receptor protein
LDWIVRYVDRLPFIAIPAVLQLDTRVAWHPSERWELSIAGRNLLDRAHPEFKPALVVTPVTEVPRSVYVKVKYGY